MLKLKIGAVVKNKVGHFTKIVGLSNGFVYFNGWHLKKEMAEKVDGTNGTAPLNERGFARAIAQTLDTDTVEETAEETTENAEPEATEETETETVEENAVTTAPADVVKATKGKGKGKAK